jgi:hypothetical protein
MSDTPNIFGMQIIESPWMPETSPKEYGHADWRERLNRNLNRPSTGRWEPLTYFKEETVLFMLGDRWYANPKAVVALRGACKP